MTKTPYPSETADRYIVRFPQGMRDAIREAAEKNGRSMNAEIIHRLEASLAVGKLSPDDFLSIQEMQYVNATKIADILRDALSRVETLAVGGVIFDAPEDEK